MNAVTKPNFRAPWGALSPREHSVQVYRDDSALLDSLEGFATGGLIAGEGVVIIATATHLHELEKRLRALPWLEIDRARWDDRYIALLAHETLQSFMVDGHPDPVRFEATVRPIIGRARAGGRPMRAFGEMVALLWRDGNPAGAIELERLWNDLIEREEFPLFCAYPRSAFKGDDRMSRHAVCTAHNRIVV